MVLKIRHIAKPKTLMYYIIRPKNEYNPIFVQWKFERTRHLFIVASYSCCRTCRVSVFKPNRYSGTTIEWIFTFSIIIILTVYFCLHKRFVNITFDRSEEKIILTTTTLLSGTKINHYDYADISYWNGKDAGNFRKRATPFVEIYNKKQKLIKLERTTIGAYPFDNILAEFEQLKNSISISYHSDEQK